MSGTALVWFRRDFRLADNPALDHARGRHRRVVPVYVHDPESEGHWAPGAASRWWLHDALGDLDERLASRGSRLIVRAGETGGQLDELVRETGAVAVYWNRLYEPAIVERDRRIKRRLRRAGLEATGFRAAVLFEPWELQRDGSASSGGGPYKVFTPYWNRMQRDWRGVARRPEPRELPGVDPGIRSQTVESLGLLPDHPWPDSLAEHWEIGELAGRRRLGEFADDAVRHYHGRRDRPDRPGTSRLSPYLHFGHVSPAQAVAALSPSGELPGGRGPLAFVRELAWREFSTMLLHHFPETPDRPLQGRFEAFPWRKPDDYADDLHAWQRGRTGVPLVDAGMRELRATGWMHNRVRMVVASYLTKNLLIPWLEGARWFWDELVDADLANNTQGWQWTAGCGADAAPYFRVFNPELQAGRFDPDAAYIGRWCPELGGLGPKALARLGDDERRRRGYPAMRIDLKAGRERALAAYGRVSG
ncbi:MAG: deoxyribodipyrimidine photo-lyase [Wenzhouxiangellaceae bacterium]|nr:deoxyribodipyrimidine photo-lyase [Wenzhouxiangellaceae bacterium]